MVNVVDMPGQGKNNLRPLERRALRNAARLVASLSPGEAISREEIIEELRQALPPEDERESDAVIRHAYRHYIINADVDNAEMIVTYAEAAALTGKSVEAIRQAAYRGAVIKLTEYRDGRERSGVVLRSLADWCNWDPKYFEKSARLAEELRKLREVDPRRTDVDI